MDNLPETLEFVKQGVILVTKVQRQWDIGYVIGLGGTWSH
jgi:hypothetical protein